MVQSQLADCSSPTNHLHDLVRVQLPLGRDYANTEMCNRMGMLLISLSGSEDLQSAMQSVFTCSACSTL